MIGIKWFNKKIANLATNYWAIPAFLVLLAFLLNLVVFYIDTTILHNSEWADFIRLNDAASARAALSLIASTMMTVAGVSFSMTLLAVVHVGSQIGPRILSGFLDDRANQVVLGILVSSFVYGLLTLITVHISPEYQNAEGVYFIPKLGVIISLLSALCGVFSFIYFIHHVPLMIRTTYAVNKVGDQTIKKIKDFFRKDFPAELDYLASKPFQEYSYKLDIFPKTNGYLEFLDKEELVELCRKEEVVIQLHDEIGDFIHTEKPYYTIYSDNIIKKKIKREISNFIVFGSERSMKQDFKFGFFLLLEIGARALSPGINDPFTFNECVDQLSVAFKTLDNESHECNKIVDKDNTVRVIMPQFQKERFIQKIYESLEYYVKDDPQAKPHLLQRVGRLQIQLTPINTYAN